MTYKSLFAILLIVMIGPKLFAQDGGAPQNSLLPAIDPQDIEIRSEFKARFPGLRRQPILGFNPKPRVFRIDPNRLPFMESPEQAVASISTTQLDRPSPPPQNILRTPVRTNAYLRAGIGNYITPEIEGYILRRMNESSLISGNVNFRSSDGHLDYQDSGFRYFDLNGIYSKKLKNNTRVAVKADFYNDFNRIFNLATTVPNDNSGTAKKDYLGLTAGFILSGNKNVLEGWEYYLNLATTGIDLSAPNTAFKGEISEQSIKTGFEKNWAGSKLNETLSSRIDLKAGNYTSEGVGKTQWIDVEWSLGYNMLFNYKTKVSISGGLGYIADGFNNKVLFVTNSSVDHSVNNKFSIKASVFATPEMRTVWEHHQTNRFLNASTQLEYEYTYGAEGGIEFTPVLGTKLFGLLRFENISNKAFYAREEQIFGGNLEPLYYDVNYGDASVFELKTGITQQLITDKVWFDGNVYARRPKLKNAGDIPFEERIGGDVAMSFKPVNKFTIQSWANFKGEREDANNARKLSGFVLVNAGADYEINSKFGVYFKVLNILGEKYEIWQGYEERPFQIYGGIKLKL